MIALYSYIMRNLQKMTASIKDAYAIIPPDYLHEIEGENHRCPLSQEELDMIVEYCVRNNFSEDEIVQVVRKLEYARIGSILLERFLDGELDIKPIGNNEVTWRPKNAD